MSYLFTSANSIVKVSAITWESVAPKYVITVSSAQIRIWHLVKLLGEKQKRTLKGPKIDPLGILDK